jgi:MFS family permease
MSDKSDKAVANNSGRKVSDVLFILWAGGTALLSYSLVYALRKPYTAAAFAGYEVFDMDYKVVVTVVQILGYALSKFIGIKLISELKPKDRLRFILLSVGMAEISLIFFGLLPAPYNMIGMFLNGLSLGCMWGVIFSYLEGRRTTDILASLMGVSMVISSGAAKSVGLFVMNTLNVSEFWMPALIGAAALPLLGLMGVILNRLPQPDACDVACRNKREPLDGKQRLALFRNFMPFLTVLFIANVALVILRDIKEDFLVNIVDVSLHSSWLFAQIDAVVTVVILFIFGLLVYVRSNLRTLTVLLVMIIVSTVCMTVLSFGYEQFRLGTVAWLFVQSLCLYLAYLTFQTIFFDRFIACFKIRGNVGFFIVLNDFLGYTGTILVLAAKEFFDLNMDWTRFYNRMAGYVGLICCVAFVFSLVYLHQRYRREYPAPGNKRISVADAKVAYQM